MGVGVISDNVSLKVSQAVSNQRTSTGTMYTCAANSYALVQICATANGSGLSVTIDGQTVLNYSTASLNVPYSFYVGPNQAVACSIGTTGTVSITGVQFINSP